MKKTIDNCAPTQYEFLKSRAKKEQLPLSRGNEIQRENSILIQKLTTIMNRPAIARSSTQGNINTSAASHYQQHLSTSPDVRLNSTESMKRIPTQQYAYSNNASPYQYERTSLNKEVRKKRFVEIVIENQALMKRIQTQKSEYNVRVWNQERARNEQFISNISEYQYKDLKPTKTFVKLGVWADQSAPSTSSSNRNRSIGKLQPLFKKNSLHGSNSRILFKNGKKIGSFIYLIEVKVQNGYFLINLENLQIQGNDYSIQLMEQQGLAILEVECRNKVELLLEKIEINEKLKTIGLKVMNRNGQASRGSVHTQRTRASAGRQELNVMEENEEEDEHSNFNSHLVPEYQQQEQYQQFQKQKQLHQQSFEKRIEKDSFNKIEQKQQLNNQINQSQSQSGMNIRDQKDQRINSDQDSGNEYEELNVDDDY